MNIHSIIRYGSIAIKRATDRRTIRIAYRTRDTNATTKEQEEITRTKSEDTRSCVRTETGNGDKLAGYIRRGASRKETVKPIKRATKDAGSQVTKRSKGKSGITKLQFSLFFILIIISVGSTINYVKGNYYCLVYDSIHGYYYDTCDHLTKELIEVIFNNKLLQ